MSPSDSMLLERWAARRDADAFAELVSRYSGMVYGTCRRVLGNAADAEDVVQECFLELAQSGRRVTHSLGGWLHTVAVRRSLDRRKSDARRRRRESNAAAGFGPCEPAWDDIRPHIDEAIGALPPKLRDPIVLRFLEGRTHEGVAQGLSLPKSTVEYRLQRGLDQIRRHLAQRGILPGLAALGALLEAHTVEAAPAELTASLGKLAIAAAMKPGMGAGAGAGSAAAKMAAAGGSLVMKKALLGLVVLALIGAMYGIARVRATSGAEAPVAASTVVAEASAMATPAAETPAAEAEPAAMEAEAPAATAAPADEKTDAKEAPAPAASAKAAGKKGDRIIAGQVVDAGGKGVPGARVAAAIEGFKTEGFDGTAGADGRFRIEGLPDTTFVVGASSPEGGTGYVSGVKAGATGVRVRLEAGARVAGRVYDEASGDGIAGVTVCARGLGEQEDSPLGIVQARVQVSGASDAEGRYEVPVKAGVELAVAVQDAGTYAVPAPFPKPVQAALGKTADGVDFALTRGGTILGTVYDAQGEPCPDAHVLLLVLTGKPHTRDTRSEADGTYAFAGVTRGDTYAVLGRLGEGVAGYSSDRFIFPADADMHTVDLRLGEGRDVPGRVEDQDGNAVAGLDVRVGINYAGEAGWSLGCDYVMAATDAEGAFVMRGLTPANYFAAVTDTRYERAFAHFSVPEDGDVSEVLIRVQEKQPGFVSGRVVDAAEKPVYPARIIASKPSGEFIEFGATDTGGAFLIEGLGSVDTVKLSVLVPGSGSPDAGGEFPVNTSDIVIVVTRAGRVRGRVIDATTNKPVPGAEVNTLERWTAGGGRLYPSEGFWQPVSEDGTFEMEIPYARVRLGARAKGYSVGSVDAIDVPEGQVVEGITIGLLPGNEVRGTVTDGSGAPLANARVGLIQGMVPLNAAEAQRCVVTGADGRYSLGSFPANSTVTVAAWANGHAVAVAMDKAVESEGPTEIDLALAPEGRIDGTIAGTLPGKGLPILLVEYRFRESPMLMGHGGFLVGVNGRFTVEGLPAGRYELAIRSHQPTQHFWSGVVDVVAGQTTNVPITLGPAGALAVRVEGLADPSQVGLVLTLQTDPQTTVSAGGFDAEGRCEIAYLPAGVYDARLISYDGQTIGSATITVAEGAPTEVVIPAQ